MAEAFLRLPVADRAGILNTAAQQIGRRGEVLEKDVWVCWVLREVFRIQAAPAMAFKGGTSLSKVYGVIQRFSEDVDLSLDYRAVAPGFDPAAPGISRTRRDRFREDAAAFVVAFAQDRVMPHLEAAMRDEFGTRTWDITIEDGEKVRLYYPSAFEASGGYVAQSVMLELGARNITEPKDHHEIKPDMADFLAELGLDFPVAEVKVLAAERTFWEKATLVHVENGRGELRQGADRLARHWYDLALLAPTEIATRALKDRPLAQAVVDHKKALFNAAHADYDRCLAGDIRLVPSSGTMTALRRDYEAMVAGGMFYSPAPTFEHLIETVTALQERINTSSAAPPAEA